MKCLCTKCNKEISKEVEKAIENYELGHIVCPNCKMKQKRYLSEADILVYFTLVSIFYCLLISLFLFIYDTFGINVPVVISICIIFIVSYFLLKQITRFIYEKAPFKTDIKNYEIEEDKEAVTKRMKWQFIAFMVVALMMSAEPTLAGVYSFLLVAFAGINSIKLYLSIKNERNYVYNKYIK